MWQNRPELRVLTGPSSATIRAQIQALPSVPFGDQVPQAGIVSKMSAYERANQQLAFHEAQRPSDIRAVDARGLTADNLRELASTLETSIPDVDSNLEARHHEEQNRLRKTKRSVLSRSLIAGAAVAGILGGIGMWMVWHLWTGAALMVCGVAALLLLVFRSGDKGRVRMLEGVLEIEAQVVAERRIEEVARERLNKARSRIIELGLPVDAGALRELADRMILATRHQQLKAEWETTQEVFHSEAAKASTAFAEALIGVGIVETGDLTSAFQEYERACESRKKEADRAAGGILNQQLFDRETAEKAVDDARAQWFVAEEKIMTTLARCGLDVADPEKGSEALRRWQNERKALLSNFDEETREHAELTALLDGGTLADLENRTLANRRQATAMASGLSQILEIPVENLDEQTRAAERDAYDATHVATVAEVQALERGYEAPNVPEAEEVLASAQQEWERVTRLGRTLNVTLDFLRKAEERVHRDIAPLLAAGLRRWLSQVTHGRYSDARVDPRDLSVQVLGPDNEWRDARHLSHGTAEQIYLLLRAVLAEHLATTGETCPLILDDVLVQCDRLRKHALLDVIVSLSCARQVILLTQEEEVLRWAHENVITPNRVVVLPGPAPAPIL